MGEPELDADAFNAFEAEGWNAVVSGYHDFFGQVTGRCAEPLLDAAAVGAGTRVLDVATGPGYVAERAAARGASTVGVDVVRDMVALAARLHPAAEFVVGDAERLPFGDASFDAVVAGFCVLHLARPEQAVADWVRVLRPGGRLATTMWDAPARNRFLGVLFDALVECDAAPPPDLPAGPPIFRFSDETELRGLIRGAGLAAVAVEPVAFTQCIESPDALWDGLVDGTVRTRSLVLGQNDEQRRRLRECFERHCAEHAANGVLELPVTAWIASGRKPA